MFICKNKEQDRVLRPTTAWSLPEQQQVSYTELTRETGVPARGNRSCPLPHSQRDLELYQGVLDSPAQFRELLSQPHPVLREQLT